MNMTRPRRTKFTLTAIEALEDRALLSATHVHAKAAGGNSASVQAQLAQADVQINAAYSTFGVNVTQAESMIAAGQTSAAASAVSQDILVLQQSLIAATQTLTSGNSAGLIAAQISGPTPGSLSSGLGALLATASQGTTSGSVPSSSFRLLQTAVVEEITASYSSATIEAYLFATGSASGNTSKLNLPQFSPYANAAYGSFTSTVTKANQALIAPAGSQGTPGTAVAVVTVANAQVGGLFQSLSAFVAKTPVASRAAALQGQFVGSTPGSLQSQLNALYGASAAVDGSIPQSALPLLFSAIEHTIAASSNATAVEAYILATA